MADQTDRSPPAPPWNKGKLVAQKPPLRLHEIWTPRTRLPIAGRTRELVLCNRRSTASGAVVAWCVYGGDVAHREEVLARASVVPQKTAQPVRFELTEQTRHD